MFAVRAPNELKQTSNCENILPTRFRYRQNQQSIDLVSAVLTPTAPPPAPPRRPSLQRLDEAGVTEKLYRSILRQREVCRAQLASPTTLLQTLGAFLLLLAGIVSSALLLFAERLHNKAGRRNGTR